MADVYMLDFVSDETINRLRELGCIHEDGVRNLTIYHQFRQLRVYTKYGRTLEILAETYCLSIDRIRNIIFDMKKLDPKFKEGNRAKKNTDV